jgi:hypothetical protein
MGLGVQHIPTIAVPFLGAVAWLQILLCGLLLEQHCSAVLRLIQTMHNSFSVSFSFSPNPSMNTIMRWCVIQVGSFSVLQG